MKKDQRTTQSTSAPATSCRATITRIIDGDTVEVATGGGLFAKPASARVRLWGMDAPESTQQGGDQATRNLQRIVGRRQKVWLRTTGVDQYGRTIAIIQPDRNSPIQKSCNYRMVQDGHAVVYMATGADGNIMRQAEKQARSTKKGMWKYHNVQEPRLYRAKRQRHQSQGNVIGAIIILITLAALLIFGAYQMISP